MINIASVRRVAAIVAVMAVVGQGLASCGEGSDALETERGRIRDDLNRQRIYDRHNLPEETVTISGYYDVVNGAFRYVVNEDREGRNSLGQIAAGDSVSFMFDARIYGGSFDGSQTFYTNIESRQAAISGNNPNFNTQFWPTVPFRIKVGEDSNILKSVQTALIGCRAIPAATDGDEDETESDIVRLYLTSNIAFGTKPVYSVPGGSTLVFELTDIKIIE